MVEMQRKIVQVLVMEVLNMMNVVNVMEMVRPMNVLTAV